MTAIACPACGATGEPIPVVYGMPGPDGDLLAASERGEVVLGGCSLTGDDPEWACATCREPVAIRVATQATDGGLPEGVDGPFHARIRW